MKRLVPLALSFACGIAICWAYQNSQPESRPTSSNQPLPMDGVQKITVIEPVRPDWRFPITHSLEPCVVYHGNERHTIRPVDPQKKAWTVTLEGHDGFSVVATED